MSEKFDEAFAVCRFEMSHVRQRGELRQRDFAVVKVLRSEEAAKDEVQRLNVVNRRKGCIYFHQVTRVERETSPE